MHASKFCSTIWLRGWIRADCARKFKIALRLDWRSSREVIDDIFHNLTGLKDKIVTARYCIVSLSSVHGKVALMYIVIDAV